MSKYDKEREQLGIKPTNSTSTSKTNNASKYAEERSNILNPPAATENPTLPPLPNIFEQSKNFKERINPKVEVKSTNKSSLPSPGENTKAPQSFVDSQANRSKLFPDVQMKQRPTLSKLSGTPTVTTSKYQPLAKDDISGRLQRQEMALNSPVTKAIEKVTGLDMSNPKVQGVIRHGQKAAELASTFNPLGGMLQASKHLPSNPVTDKVNALVSGFKDSASLGVGSYINRLSGNTNDAEAATQTGAGKVGQFAGMLVPGTAAFKAANVATRGIGNQVLRTGLRGAAAGGLYGAARESGEAGLGVNKQSLGGRALDVGLDVALGGALDLGVLGLSKGIGMARGVARDVVGDGLGAVNAIEQVGRQGKQVDNAINQLADIDEQLVNLRSRGNTGGTFGDEAQSLMNDRAQTIEYIKKADPEFLEPQLPEGARTTTLPSPDVILGQRAASADIPVTAAPRISNPQTGERGFIRTLEGSDNLNQASRDALGQSPNRKYDEITNEETLTSANKRIELLGIDEAEANLLNKSKYKAEDIATGMRLIQKLQENGNTMRAVNIAENLAKQLTEAGQTVQAASIWSRLSPEGALIAAQRKVNRVNENLFL